MKKTNLIWPILSLVICCANNGFAQKDTWEEVVEPAFLQPIGAGIKLSGKLPKDYWARQMKPGEVQKVNKAVRRNLAGVSGQIESLDKGQKLIVDQPPQDLIEPIEGDSSDAAEKRISQRIKLSDWMLEREFATLPTKNKEDLRNVLHGITRQIATIQENFRRGKKYSDKDVNAAHEQISLQLAKALIAHRESYKGLPQQQLKKFGRQLDYSKPFKSEKEIADKLLPFIKGEYLKDEKKRAESVKTKHISNISRAMIDVAQVVRERTRPALQSTYTLQYPEGPAEYVAVEGRIFVSEHPVISSDWWEQLFDSIVHSSIVAGYWLLERQKVIVEQYKTQYPATGRELISRQRITINTWRFHQWLWANGDAGSYNPDDTLTLVEQVSCSDFEDCDKNMFSYTPTGKGEYCRNRATSYTQGLYGINFVCHQNANAFMNHRRGYEPVFHWYSSILFGTHGTSGISECATVYDKAMFGCIPGNWCQGNHIPYTVDDPWSLAFELAPGDGWGLSRVWRAKPGKELWIDSEAHYNAAEINVAGKDDDPIVESIEELPLQ